MPYQIIGVGPEKWSFITRAVFSRRDARFYRDILNEFSEVSGVTSDIWMIMSRGNPNEVSEVDRYCFQIRKVGFP